MSNKSKHNILWKFSVFLFLILFVISMWAVLIDAYYNSWWYKITNGWYITDLSDNSTPNKIDEWICRVVTSETCSSDVFVPTNTSDEYNSFLTNLPSCVTLWSCLSCGSSVNSCQGGTVSNVTTLYWDCWIPCGLDESENTYHRTCSNWKDSVDCLVENTCDINPKCWWSSCFIAWTLIRMADGSEKNIENIITWDIVLWSSGSLNTVNKLWKLPHDSLLYAFNGWKKFVTDSHPFMTTSWWKSFSPEKTKYESPDLIVTYLRTWDILIKENWKQEKIENIQTIHRSGYVYNFRLNNTHEYYADGYLVHNPQQK